MKRLALLLFLVPTLMFAQTWRGHTSGYVQITFVGNGASNAPPNTYTTAYSTDGLTWANTGGNWFFGGWDQTNAIEAAYINGKYYAFNACSSDPVGLCVPWQVGIINDTSGVVSTVAKVDWTGTISGVVTCFEPGVVRNSDNSVYMDDGYVHLIIPCSTGTALTPFTAYETHSSPTDMVTWSSPVALSGFPSTGYDEKIYKIGSTFYAWLTDHTNIILYSSSTLTGSYTGVKTGDWNGWGGSYEGPFAYPAPSGSGYIWYLYFEKFPNGALVAPVLYYSACNNIDFNSCTWTAKSTVTTDYRYRHGTVIQLVAP